MSDDDLDRTDDGGADRLALIKAYEGTPLPPLPQRPVDAAREIWWFVAQQRESAMACGDIPYKRREAAVLKAIEKVYDRAIEDPRVLEFIGKIGGLSS